MCGEPNDRRGIKKLMELSRAENASVNGGDGLLKCHPVAPFTDPNGNREWELETDVSEPYEPREVVWNFWGL